MAYYTISYVLYGDQRRAESVGMALYPYGLMVVYDRYYNSDDWYEFDMDGYLEQHPEEKPELDSSRFDRPNSS